MAAPQSVVASVDILGREFEYTDADFERVRKMIYARAGISLAPLKRDMVYSRLARRLRTLGLKRFRDYLTQLEEKPGSEEWQAFANALTTNLTSFFREEHHFVILREHLLKLKDQPAICVWCSASSTGEEPYSIAMTAAEVWGTAPAPVTITATDVDTNVLKTAKEGIYSLERLERLAPERVRKHFLKGERGSEGLARIRPELQSMIEFHPLNLLDARYAVRGPFDAIFCCNVLIYFDKATQASIIKKMVPLLKPHGLLFIGHSENLLHMSESLKLQGKTVYAHAPKKEV